jgi:3-oxoadipate enol-lactonase
MNLNMSEMTFNKKTQQVNGVSISYYDEGAGDVPFIFIHGFPFSKECWKGQVSSLSSETRVIAPDLRGFGNSTSNKEVASIDLFSSDLLALLDTLQIDKAVMCGISMGGYILMNALARYPERFAGAVLCDTQCIADSEEGKEKRYQNIRKIEEQGLNDFTETFLKGIFCEKTFKEKKEVVDDVRNIILANRTEAVTSALHALAQRRETCTVLKRLQLPTLVICGKEDAVTTVSQSELIFNSISGSALKVINDAGHMSNLEQPEIFNSELKRFHSEILKVNGRSTSGNGS